jgi:hypothetical protein
MEYTPDGLGSPYFMDKNWAPELPDYDIFVAPPTINDFESKYVLKVDSAHLDGDYLVSDNLASSLFLDLCKEFGVNLICRPLEVQLLNKKSPEKKYFLFFLADYMEILDKEKSTYIVSTDIDSGLPDTPEDRGLDKTYYDKIDVFIVNDNVSSNLFFCQDISKPVCSGEFKNKFEALGLKSIEFHPLDESFRYDAWAGW